MHALAAIVTSDRVRVDAARQARNWSGTLYDDRDHEEAIKECLTVFSPPEEHRSKEAGQNGESTEFRGSIKFNSTTHNYAFSKNMPRFDVRDQCHKIKVSTNSESIVSTDYWKGSGCYSRDRRTPRYHHPSVMQPGNCKRYTSCSIGDF